MKKKLALAFLITLTLLLIVVATLFDMGCGFVYLPRLPIAVMASLAVLPFAFASRRATLVCSAIIFAAILGISQVRWNHLKSFFIDADSLRAGMTLTDVRHRMSPYLEVDKSNPPMPPPPPEILAQFPEAFKPPGFYGAVVPGLQETNEEHESRILFIPDESHNADWCIVYSKDGIVERVEISPD
jgi:hypothetical protein